MPLPPPVSAFPYEFWVHYGFTGTGARLSPGKDRREEKGSLSLDGWRVSELGWRQEHNRSHV
ncbi:hypothetical protein SO3561_06808 [Streptomyces olivochromogenes]|uniref:Uncharacterized protein n=1 Tax=Streptomyces olivochromogenes TaxID=1963 RepID=A0A250VM12_STROL|nr:hypothetical protein SO3561_06808 [Streptomyces olivochromogenes]